MNFPRRFEATLMVGDQPYPAYELRNLLMFVAQYYGERHQMRLCQEIGIGLSEVSQMQFVSVWQVDYAMAYLSQLDANLELGAKLGASCRLQDLGYILHHLSTCATLGDCLNFVISSPQLVGSVSDTLLGNGKQVLSLRWLNTAKIARGHFRLQFLNSVCSMLAIARQLTLQPIVLDQLCLVDKQVTHSSCDFLPHYTQANVRYNSPFYEWSINRQQLALPICFDFHAISFERNYVATPSFIESILCELKRGFPDTPKLQQMATIHNVSARTLRRRLALAGTSYQKLIDQVRCQTAIALIVQGDCSTQEIAELMGFGEVSHFRQSFKHWLGYPPGYFKRQL